MEATQAAGSIRRGRFWGRALLGVHHDIQLRSRDHHVRDKVFAGGGYFEHLHVQQQNAGRKIYEGNPANVLMTSC